MLTLRIKSGEYITIGEDVAVQIFDRPGDSFEVSIKAPREVPIFRSGVFERSESRPDGLKDQRVKPPSEKRRDEKRLRALARREAWQHCWGWPAPVLRLRPGLREGRLGGGEAVICQHIFGVSKALLVSSSGFSCGKVVTGASRSKKNV